MILESSLVNVCHQELLLFLSCYVYHISMGGSSLLSQLLKVAGAAQQQLDLLLEIEVGLLLLLSSSNVTALLSCLG